MIVKRIYANALDATEPYLLVPVPADVMDTNDMEGFAEQVFREFPQTARSFHFAGSLALGEVKVFPAEGSRLRPRPEYDIATVAVHERKENGWLASADTMYGVLEFLHSHHRVRNLAVAGTPDAGSSGVRSGFNRDLMVATLRRSSMDITMYDHEGLAGQPAALLREESPRTEHAVTKSLSPHSLLR